MLRFLDDITTSHMREKEMVAYTQSEREKKKPRKKNSGRDWFYFTPLKPHSILRGLHKAVCIVINI